MSESNVKKNEICTVVIRIVDWLLAHAMKKTWTNIWFSFPIQLVVLHFKYNLLLTAIWLLIGSLITGKVASNYGIKYLFWTPEYLGAVDFWSFFFLGLSFASFTMTWNLTTYMLSAHHFPFLASLARPFTKFCINNFILPFFYIGMIISFHIRFEIQEQQFSYESTFYNIFGFLFGLISMVSLLIAYFIYTNKNIFTFTDKEADELPPNLMRSVGPGRGLKIEEIQSETKGRRVAYYLTESFVPRRVRSVSHYSLKVLHRVFKQNHANALAVQMTSLFVLVALGLLIEHPSFRIPAGASIFLLFSIVITLVGAIMYWFNRWSLTFFVGLFVLLNFMTKQGWFNHENKAYGLDYSEDRPAYTYQNLEDVFSTEAKAADVANTIEILENWKQKTGQEKPKMLMIGVSGGGLKATAWTMQVLRMADSLTNGQMMKQTALMSGASGGMMGMSYFRELYYRIQLGEPIDLYKKSHVNDVAKDLLNSVAFTIVTNDIFIPKGTFDDADKRYTKDRGYVFEQQFNENTHRRLDRRLGEYTQAEYDATIPLMFLTPYIINDARRLIISTQPVSYMTAPPYASNEVDIDAIDFQRFFQAQKPDSLRFLSALRMNATYPYVLPNVTLPTSPDIEVMDAGYRDNFGHESIARFVSVFQDWIKANTSGVVMLSIRVVKRNSRTIQATDNDGIFKSMLDPLGIAGKIIQLQDYEHDMYISLMEQILGEKQFEVIPFSYQPTTRNEEASMTFHLTPKEREDILSAICTDANNSNLKYLKKVLGDGVK